jgi:hypothetical protein
MKFNFINRDIIVLLVLVLFSFLLVGILTQLGLYEGFEEGLEPLPTICGTDDSHIPYTEFLTLLKSGKDTSQTPPVLIKNATIKLLYDTSQTPPVLSKATSSDDNIQVKLLNDPKNKNMIEITTSNKINKINKMYSVYTYGKQWTDISNNHLCADPFEGYKIDIKKNKYYGVIDLIDRKIVKADKLPTIKIDCTYSNKGIVAANSINTNKESKGSKRNLVDIIINYSEIIKI